MEYLVGTFFDSTHENILDQLNAAAGVPAFGTSTLLDAPVQIHGRESALFGEGTWHFTDQFKITLGGRLFQTRLTTITGESGPFVGASSTTEGGSRQTGFSPRPRLPGSPIATPFSMHSPRRGSASADRTSPAIRPSPIPSQFASDSLWNYELGARSTLLGNRLQLDGTLYWIDWNNIQVTETSPGGFTYTANAGQARNRGFEANATYQLVRALSLQGSVTYLDGELRRDFDSGMGLIPAGSQLPGASRWQVSDLLVYAPMGSSLAPTFSISDRYLSSAPGRVRPLRRGRADTTSSTCASVRRQVLWDLGVHRQHWQRARCLGGHDRRGRTRAVPRPAAHRRRNARLQVVRPARVRRSRASVATAMLLVCLAALANAAPPTPGPARCAPAGTGEDSFCTVGPAAALRRLGRQGSGGDSANGTG